MKGVICMEIYSYVVPLSTETKKRLAKHLGGASYDADDTEIRAFIFGVAQEFWEQAYQYGDNYQDVVEFFELKAEIAKAIAANEQANRVWRTGKELNYASATAAQLAQRLNS